MEEYCEIEKENLSNPKTNINKLILKMNNLLKSSKKKLK